MSNFAWTMKLYDRLGQAINVNSSSVFTGDPSSTNTILHAADRQLNFNLNGVDDLSFNILLKDPMAYVIKELTTFVKVWRSVPGYSDPSNQPCFAGQVGAITKSGAQGQMAVKVYSPFSRLQTRFHILNHYLNVNVDTGNFYKQSELIWKIIKLINEAFGLSVSYTGIDKGIFYDISTEIDVAPYFIPKGTNVWAEIFDSLLSLPDSIDLIPRYFHADGNALLMYLDTARKRGTDKSASVNFSYHTDRPSNCVDMEESALVAPYDNQGNGGFANYIWAVGQGGPNSGKIALAEDAGGTGYGYNSIGIYMARLDYPDIKRVGTPGTDEWLRGRAKHELLKAIVPKHAYTVTLNPAASIYYQKDYSLGDVVMLNANRDALQVSNVKQRLWQVGLQMSNNNMETVVPVVANDFTGKVAP